MNREELEALLDEAMASGNAEQIIEVSAKLEALDDESGVTQQTATPAVSDDEVTDLGSNDNSESANNNASQSVDTDIIDVSHIAPPSELLQVDEPTTETLSAEQQAQVEELQQKVALYAQQLENNGLEPEKLPHELSITQSQLDALREELEELGPVGSVAYTTAQMLGNMQQQLLQIQQSQTATNQNESEPATPTFDDFCKEVPGLKEVMANPETESLAVKIDNSLRSDERWKGVSDVARFRAVVAEVNKMSASSKGQQKGELTDDDVAAFSIASAQANSQPTSNPIERLEGLSEYELHDELSGLGVEQLQSLMKNL